MTDPTDTTSEPPCRCYPDGRTCYCTSGCPCGDIRDDAIGETDTQTLPSCGVAGCPCDDIYGDATPRPQEHAAPALVHSGTDTDGLAVYTDPRPVAPGWAIPKQTSDHNTPAEATAPLRRARALLAWMTQRPSADTPALAEAIALIDTEIAHLLAAQQRRMVGDAFVYGAPLGTVDARVGIYAPWQPNATLTSNPEPDTIPAGMPADVAELTDDIEALDWRLAGLVHYTLDALDDEHTDRQVALEHVADRLQQIRAGLRTPSGVEPEVEPVHLADQCERPDCTERKSERVVVTATWTGPRHLGDHVNSRGEYCSEHASQVQGQGLVASLRGDPNYTRVQVDRHNLTGGAS